MRFAPDGHALAYTLGYGGGGLSIQVVAVGASGAVLAVFPAGHDPRWITARHLIARSPDGSTSSTTVAGYVCEYVGANQGDLDAAASRLAYAGDRAQGVRAYAGGTPVQTFPSTFEPGLSPGGTLALRDLGTGAIRLERLTGCRDVAAHDPQIGPATRPRWSSQSLVVDTVPYGRVLGRTSPDQPTVELSVPGRATTHPVALWTGARLFVGVVLDDGELVVADWAWLQARAALGWVVAASGGSAFDWDLAVAPWSATRVLVAYLTPGGFAAIAEVDTTRAAVDVSRPVTPEPPEPEPGPEPPEPGPEPPEPGPEPGPEPEPPPTEPDMTAADIRRYISELGNDLVVGAVTRFHNDVLPRDRPLDPLVKSAAWTEGDLRLQHARRDHGRGQRVLRPHLHLRVPHRTGRGPHRAPGLGRRLRRRLPGVHERRQPAEAARADRARHDPRPHRDRRPLLHRSVNPCDLEKETHRDRTREARTRQRPPGHPSRP